MSATIGTLNGGRSVSVTIDGQTAEADIDTRRSDAIAAKWGEDHPLFGTMQKAERQDARDAAALALHSLHCHCATTCGLPEGTRIRKG